jgi:ferrochelatase
MPKQAVLLVNLGTPDNCDPSAVRRYLKEFLSDPRVIDLSCFIRWPLVNWFILPSRHKKSAALYQKIWEEGGSPLLINMRRLTAALNLTLGPDYQIEFAMRYQQPNMAATLAKFKNCHRLTVIPLFPQYSSAATGSAIEAVLKLLSGRWNIPEIRIIRDFYNLPGFIQAYAELIKTHTKATDFVLFSYHGLPERHINKSLCQAQCDHVQACPMVQEDNLFCYRAQCYATTELIAAALDLQPHQYAVSFQSRLGRTPWIKPYTDLLLPDLIHRNIKNLAVVSPSFVSDCLETLEEINIRTRAQWQALGGHSFTSIPCVNDSPLWVDALKNLILS